MAHDWIGKVVGNCRIEEQLGEGGCGQVYRGVDLMLERPVAIKVLHPALAAQSDVIERFRTEAHTLARLSHPNIATLYSFLREGTAYLMVMEYVEGQTFDALIRSRRSLPLQEALPLFFQSLDGIHHAHAAGVVHRDIKGSNVMRSAGGLVKVMDFGIARALGSQGLTQSGQPVGTPAYMAPEQVRGEEIDRRSDIYSLGVLLFKMLTGRIPFWARSHYEVMRAHVEQPPPALRDFEPSLPVSVEQVLLRAMAKSPSDRFATAGELRAALEDALDASPVAAELADTAPQTPALSDVEVVPDADTTPIPLTAPLPMLAEPADRDATTLPGETGSTREGPTLTPILAGEASLGIEDADTDVGTQSTAGSQAEPTASEAPSRETPRTPSRRRLWVTGLVGGALLVALSLGVFWIEIRKTGSASAAAAAGVAQPSEPPSWTPPLPSEGVDDAFEPSELAAIPTQVETPEPGTVEPLIEEVAATASHEPTDSIEPAPPEEKTEPLPPHLAKAAPEPEPTEPAPAIRQPIQPGLSHSVDPGVSQPSVPEIGEEGDFGASKGGDGWIIRRE